MTGSNSAEDVDDPSDGGISASPATVDRRLNHFRMPPEWAPQDACWLAWPHDRDIWAGDFDEIELGFAKLAREIALVEPLCLIVENAEIEGRALALIDRLGAAALPIKPARIATDDTWLRDSGPTFVHRGNALSAICWRYNAWGNKFPHEKDALVSRAMARWLGIESVDPDMVLEGGSIDVNGEGVVVTTEQCLLHPNRNSDLSRSEIENRLKRFLGVQSVLWLGEGLEGDDTDGHVDDITRFVSPKTLVTVIEPDRSDANYERLRENRARLEHSRDAKGRPFRIVELPMPRGRHDGQRRLPESYANFLILNKKVIVPTFADPHDAEALRILDGLFEDRQVVGLDARALVLGGGSIHCLTQQQPSPIT